MSGARIEALLFVLAALFFALSRDSARSESGEGPGARALGEVRFVTWNLGGADSGRPHGFREEDLESVARTLRACAADVVFLQEVGDRELLYRLTGLLGPDWKALTGPGGIATLSAHELERFRTLPSRCMGARLRIGSLEIACACVHADAFSAEARKRELGPLADALLAQPADLHVLAGDLNLDLDLDKRGDLFSSNPQLDVESYNALAVRLTDAARGGGPTAEPDRRLDYVFVSPRSTIRAARPWRGQRVGSMDHEPVVVDLAR